MGRTIPLFRIAALLEEEKWKSFRIYLRNNNEKKFFTHMFSFGNLYNSASNSINPIKIYSIMMSIVFHHYRTLTETNFSFHSSSGFEVSSTSSDGVGKDDINEYDNNNKSTTILKQELDNGIISLLS